MMKKRKVFKFEEGKPGFFKRIGNSFKKFGLNVSEYVKGIDMENLAGAVGGASQGIASSLGIEQGRTGSVINGIGQLASQVNPFVGAGLLVLGSTIGGRGSVDENTGEVTKASGLTKVFGFGKSNSELYRKAGRIKNTLVAREQTQNILADYYNDPNVEVQPNVLAAEGGIMRRPVDALVSKGELIYDPTTKELMKVPGSKGKPNKKDDVPIRLYEGDVVLSNSPTMLMANGKTPAQNVERFINKKSKSSDGTVKAREAIIKKVVNWQEANKTKPQLYAMYDEGTPGLFKYLMNNRTRPLGTVLYEWFSQQGKAAPKFNGFGKFDFLNAVKKIYNAQASYEAPIKLRDDFNWNLHRSVPIDQLFEFNPSAFATNVENKNNVSTNIVTDNNNTSSNVNVTSNPEIDIVAFRHQTNDYPVEYPVISNDNTNVKKKQTAVLTSTVGDVKPQTRIKKYAYNPDLNQFSYWDKERGDYKKEYLDWVNSLTDQDVKDIYDGKYGDMSQYLGKNKGYIPSVEEARRLMTDKKYGNWHKIGQIIKDSVKEMRITTRQNDYINKRNLPAIDPKPYSLLNYAKIENGPIKIPRLKLLPPAGDKDKSGNKTNLSDLAYKAASILTPLLDHAEPEAVNYETSIAEFRPTYVDVSKQLREIDDSYAMARYNLANISTNTGAGMAYGLLAAANRAKQMSDVYNWQTNAQNQLIGQNIDAYNKWSADYAGIMNNVYDKAAANRAAARNINRQNRATALNNWGQILKDDKLYANEQIKAEALTPLMKYAYENDEQLRKMIRERLGGNA